MADRKPNQPNPRAPQRVDPNPDPPERPDPRLGAGDQNSGGGNASGSPDGDTALRSDAALGGDVEQDKRALFPEKFGPPKKK